MRRRKTDEIRHALAYFSRRHQVELREVTSTRGRHASWILATEDGQKIYDATFNIANKEQSPGTQRDMIHRAKWYANLESSQTDLATLRNELAKFLQDQFKG